jgi:hypothetical protein
MYWCRVVGAGRGSLKHGGNRRAIRGREQSPEDGAAANKLMTKGLQQIPERKKAVVFIFVKLFSPTVGNDWAAKANAAGCERGCEVGLSIHVCI